MAWEGVVTILHSLSNNDASNGSKNNSRDNNSIVATSSPETDCCMCGV